MATPGKIKHLRKDLRWPTAAEKILASRVIEVFSHEPGVREGVDPEAVHDMRVALRRLQAALRMFAACYPPRKLRRHRLRLRRLLQTLGAVRDQDIMIDALSQHAESPPPPVKEVLARLLAQRRTAQQQERGRALRLLDKLQRGNFRDNLLDFVRRAREFRRAGSHGRFAAEVDAIAQRAHSIWNERRRQVQGQDDPEALHQMRIAVKRLRYTLELCQLAGDHGHEERVERLADIQRVLGDLHDADVLLECLAKPLPHVPLDAIGGVADIMRIVKQHRQDLAGRFFKMTNSRNLGPLKPVLAGSDLAGRHRRRPKGRTARPAQAFAPETK